MRILGECASHSHQSNAKRSMSALCTMLTQLSSVPLACSLLLSEGLSRKRGQHAGMLNLVHQNNRPMIKIGG